MNEIILDPRLGRGGGRSTVPVINGTNLPAGLIVDQGLLPDGQPFSKVNPMVAQLIRYTESVRPPSRRGTIFDRDRYVGPKTPFEEMRLARHALKDDVVGGGADNTENLALDKITFWCEDKRQRSVWNQWAEMVDLDSFLRKQWRVLYTDSQTVQAGWWENVPQIIPRGVKGPAGRSARQTFNDLWMPTALTLIDTLKVTPVGSLAFGREQLAYIATRLEAAAFDRILANRNAGGGPAVVPDQWASRYGVDPSLTDPIVERLILDRYVPDEAERAELQMDGVKDTSGLFLLDSRWVSRHCLTRPDFERFADVRLARVFALLDIKEQLRQSDRATLVGAANFIILITQGSKERPGKQEEIDELHAGVGTLAQTPVMVGDERLKVEIISPRVDSTVNRGKWDTVDLRILASVYSMFVAPEGADVNDVGKLVGRGLEGRRRMMRRWLEKAVIKPIMAANDELVEVPKLRFSPARIALDFDNAWATFLLELRENREISRDTILSQFGLDQALEAALRKMEEDEFDDVFKTAVPFAGTGYNQPGGDQPEERSGGRRGGRRGGAAPGSGQGEDPRRARTRTRTSATEALAAATAALARVVDAESREPDTQPVVEDDGNGDSNPTKRARKPRRAKHEAPPEGEE